MNDDNRFAERFFGERNVELELRSRIVEPAGQLGGVEGAIAILVEAGQFGRGDSQFLRAELAVPACDVRLGITGCAVVKLNQLADEGRLRTAAIDRQHQRSHAGQRAR